MLAVDTNIVVRLIVVDDELQARRARTLFDQNLIFISKTVLLEAEWVLRSTYSLRPRDVHAHLSTIIGLPQVRLEAPEQVAVAFDWFEQGMDFADAIHLANCDDCEAFATFDRKLVAAARKAKAGKVKAL